MTDTDTCEAAAVRTLERLGYTYTGGMEWRPPLGPKPRFDLLDEKEWVILRLRCALLFQCLLAGQAEADAQKTVAAVENGING